jgi:mannose-6-phosphate isomerase-like protein (cupin superfamily)
MSLLNAALVAGDLRGTVYTFQVAGDVLPLHVHGPFDAHITIVARGSVRVENGIMKDGSFLIEETMVLGAGRCIDTEPGVYHQFTATADDTRIFNIIRTSERGPGTAR